MWGHGYTCVYVIPPSQVNGTRSRYGQSGARSDPGDAFVLADMLRTDRGRLQVWHPDHVLTRQVVRLSNRLRAVLWRYYPAALAVFGGLDSQLEFG